MSARGRPSEVAVANGILINRKGKLVVHVRFKSGKVGANFSPEKLHCAIFVVRSRGPCITNDYLRKQWDNLNAMKVETRSRQGGVMEDHKFKGGTELRTTFRDDF
jgi:hypothetical protein